MILFCVAILCFSLPLVMLDLDQSNDEYDAVRHFTGNIILDAIYDQYLLALGDFSTNGDFDKGNWPRLMAAFFVGATFFINVTMFNMLIAIMGERFDYATDNEQNLITRTKLELLATQYPALFGVPSHEKEKTFLVVVTLAEDDGGTDWIGTIQKIDEMNRKVNSKLQ